MQATTRSIIFFVDNILFNEWSESIADRSPKIPTSAYGSMSIFSEKYMPTHPVKTNNKPFFDFSLSNLNP